MTASAGFCGGLTRGVACFVVTVSGVLAYQTGTDTAPLHLRWVDRSGRLLKELLAEKGVYGYSELSPDGRSAAFGKKSATGFDIWLADVARGSSSRFTFGSRGRSYSHPIWSPDGQRVAYGVMSGGGIYAKDANGTGAEQELLKSPGVPLSWSPDGRQILFWRPGEKLFLLPLEGGRSPIPIGPDGAGRFGARISPDGRYFAFTSGESGRNEIYVEAMPPGAGKWQISIDGGTNPHWRRDARELFFFARDLKITAVDIQLGSGVTAGVPHALFPTSVQPASYDVSADGQRFLIAAENQIGSDAPITVILNWWAGLKNTATGK